jgi:hypothetical protein
MSDTPQIGDTRPAVDDEPQALERDPRDERIAELEDELARTTPLPQVRAWAERVQRRNAELESLAVENAALKRQIGLAHAGIDPESLLGQTVVTAAAADGIDDPAQVEALARTLRAEMNGGARRHKED